MRAIHFRAARGLGFCAAVIAVCAACGSSSSDEAGPGVAPDAAVITPPPGAKIEVLRPLTLTARARLPEQSPELIDVEVLPDRLAFIYRSPTTVPFAVDDVVAGVLHDGYLRRLTVIQQMSPTRIEAMTVHAELGELIGDGHFRVKFAPGDGVGEWAPSGDLGVTKQALTTGWSGFTPKFRGITCGTTAGGTLSLTPRLDIDLGMDLDLDIAWSTHFLIPRGEVISALVELHGDLEAGLQAEATENLSASCSYDLLALAKTLGAAVPSRKWAITFAIGPVPVIVTHTIKPYAQFGAGAKVEVGRTTATAMGRVGIRAGTRYDFVDGWRPIWEPTHSGAVTLKTAEPGTLSLSAVLSGGVAYSMKIYDAVGPGVSFGPRVAGTFAASPDCNWSANVKAGLQLTGSVDVSVPVIDYKLASFSVSSVLAESTWKEAAGTIPGCVDGGAEAGPDTNIDDTSVTDTADASDSSDTFVADTSDTSVADTSVLDAAKKSNGTPCGAASECLSGFCPPQDGVCCNEQCASQCRACTAAKSRTADGVCSAIKENTDPDDECPGMQKCQAYSSSTTATAYCRAHYGDPCTGDHVSADCPGAGTCVEGVCCDNFNCHLSLSPCSSCLGKYTGFADGDCQTILAPMDPYDTCSGPSVCWGGSAASTCCLPPGSSCGTASDCCSRACTGSTCS